VVVIAQVELEALSAEVAELNQQVMTTAIICSYDSVSSDTSHPPTLHLHQLSSVVHLMHELCCTLASDVTLVSKTSSSPQPHPARC
jgi:hypothetical protein